MLKENFWYKLDKDRKVVPVSGKELADTWFEETRRVDFTDLGYVSISTVFLSLDHSGRNLDEPCYGGLTQVGAARMLGIDEAHVALRALRGDYEGSPLVFETMVFPNTAFPSRFWWRNLLGNTYATVGEFDCERCSTWKEAVAQHKKVVAKWQKKSIL